MKITLKDLLFLGFLINLVLFIIEKSYYIFTKESYESILVGFNMIFFGGLFLLQYDNFVTRIFLSGWERISKYIISFFVLGILLKNFSVNSNDTLISAIYSLSSSTIVFLITYYFIENKPDNTGNKTYFGININFIIKYFLVLMTGGLLCYIFKEFFDISKLPNFLNSIIKYLIF